MIIFNTSEIDRAGMLYVIKRKYGVIPDLGVKKPIESQNF